MQITIELTALQEKALKAQMVSIEEWFQNFVNHRAAVAIQEVYDSEVARLKADPNTTHIPVNVEDVVMAAALPDLTASIPLPAMPPTPDVPV